MTFGGGTVTVISVKDMGGDMLYEVAFDEVGTKTIILLRFFQTDRFSFSAPSKFAVMITASLIFLLPVTEGLFSPLKAPRKSTSETGSEVLFLR